MTRLPAGMYRPGYSLIHGIDAAMKLVCFFLLAIAVAATDSWPGLAAMLAATAAIVYLSQLSFAEIAAPILRIAGLLILIILVNALFACADGAWITLWIISPSPQGLVCGVFVAARVALALVLWNVLCMTASPLKLAEGFSRLFAPLRALRVPTGLLALIFTTAIRFVPILFEEADRLREAQLLRGARFQAKSFFDRAQSVMPLIIPCFLAAFRRAQELSCALEARGFRADADFPRAEAALSAEDWLALLVSMSFCALQLVVL